MLLETTTTITGERVGACWALYERAFDELRTAAVQRHVMFRSEFDGILLDERVTKYVAVDEAVSGRCLALATVTTELETMPLISPDYFAHRWPRLYADRHIWYMGFVAVAADHQRGPLCGRIVGDVARSAAAVGGIAVMDVSRYVSEQGRLPQLLSRYFARLAPGTRGIRLDEQSFWAYEFPEPAGVAGPPVAGGPL